MRSNRLIVSIILLFLLIISWLFSMEGIKSKADNEQWERVIYLWKKFEAIPSDKNAKEFYKFLSRIPKVEKKDLSWLSVHGYRFSHELLSGNKFIILAAIKLSFLAEEKEADQILMLVGKLSRIKPKLFLEVFAENNNVIEERIRKATILLPEEHEYLYRQGLLTDEFSDFLRYFCCYELQRRYQALMSVSELNSKKLLKLKEVCLEEIIKKVNRLECRCPEKYDDDEIVRRLSLLWNLAIEDKWLIFNEPLEKDKQLFDLLFRNYYEHVIYPLIEYEIFAGNMSAMRAIKKEFNVSILSAWQNTLWELSRIRPEAFLNFVLEQNRKENKVNNKMEFLSGYIFHDLKPEARIIELRRRIDLFSKIKNPEYKEIKKEYIRLMKDLISQAENK